MGDADHRDRGRVLVPFSEAEPHRGRTGREGRIQGLLGKAGEMPVRPGNGGNQTEDS